MKKKLAVVESFLNVHHYVKDLNEAVSSLITAKKPSENMIESQGDALKECYTVDNITNKFSEFNYGDGNFSCCVCDVKVAIYGVELEDDFRGKVQSDKFKTLKKSLKRHLGGVVHVDRLKINEVNDAKKIKEEHRERWGKCWPSIDARMRDKKEFKFLVKDTKTIADVYKMLNIGKEFYNFPSLCPVEERRV